MTGAASRVAMSDPEIRVDGSRGVPPLAAWLYAAVLLTLVTQVGWWRLPFHYEHGWHAADQAVMARNFAHDGVLARRGVPVRNNPPLGAQPDLAIHWPPAAPILLSLVYRLCGESEAVYHAWSAAWLAVFGVALSVLLRERYRPRVAGIALFTALVMPVTAGHAHVLGNTWLTLSLELLALLAFIRATDGARVRPRWAVLGGAAAAIGVATSWFALMLPPALLAAAAWRRQRREILLALAYAVAALATAAGVLALFLSTAPELGENLWRTLQYRMNVAPFAETAWRVHTIADHTQYTNGMSASRAIATLYVNAGAMLGALPMVAMGAIAAAGWMSRRSGSHDVAFVLFAGLFLPWLGWGAAMPQHMAYHDIAMQLLVPTAAAAFGVCGDAVLDIADRIPDRSVQRPTRLAVRVIVPLLLLLPLLRAAGSVTLGTGAAVHADMIAFGRDIRSSTPPNAIVIVPMPSMIPVYYADRHLIRGVQDRAVLQAVIERMPAVFPGSPVYLALPPADADAASIRRLGEGFPLVRSSGALRLYAIATPGDDPARSTAGALP